MEWKTFQSECGSYKVDFSDYDSEVVYSLRIDRTQSINEVDAILYKGIVFNLVERNTVIAQ